MSVYSKNYFRSCIASNVSEINVTDTTVLPIKPEALSSNTTQAPINVNNSVSNATNVSTPSTPLSTTSILLSTTIATGTTSSVRTPDDCNAPDTILEPSVLFNLWRIVYWSSQLLTWILLPLMQVCGVICFMIYMLKAIINGKALFPCIKKVFFYMQCLKKSA